MVAVCLIIHPSLSAFPLLTFLISGLLFSDIASRINSLHSNMHLRLYFWGNRKEDNQPSLTPALSLPDSSVGCSKVQAKSTISETLWGSVLCTHLLQARSLSSGLPGPLTWPPPWAIHSQPETADLLITSAYLLTEGHPQSHRSPSLYSCKRGVFNCLKIIFFWKIMVTQAHVFWFYNVEMGLDSSFIE